MKPTPDKANPYFITAAYYLGFICLGMATAVLGPTLQGLADNTASSLSQISSLFLFVSFGYLLGSFASGRVYDRVRGHPVLCLSLMVITAMLVVIPLVRAMLLLQAVFFIIGVAEGILDVGLNTLIVWLHGDRVHPFMNGLHAFYGIGTTLAPLIVAAVLSNMGSLDSVYWALAVLILPVGVLMPFFPSPSHAQAVAGAGIRPAVPLVVSLLVLIFFAFTGAELGFGGWIYTYTTSQDYASPTLAASINAAFWAALTVGRLISIPLVVKLKPTRLLWLDFCGAIASLLVIIFFSSSESLLWLGTIATGLFMGPIFPTLLNDAQSRMDISGNITSKFFVGSSLGSMAIPWLMGQVISPYGATAVMVTALASVLLATGTFYVLNLTQRKTLISPPRPPLDGINAS